MLKYVKNSRWLFKLNVLGNLGFRLSTIPRPLLFAYQKASLPSSTTRPTPWADPLSFKQYVYSLATQRWLARYLQITSRIRQTVISTPHSSMPWNRCTLAMDFPNIHSNTLTRSFLSPWLIVSYGKNKKRRTTLLFPLYCFQNALPLTGKYPNIFIKYYKYIHTTYCSKSHKNFLEAEFHVDLF